jgi:hypothetical protein
MFGLNALIARILQFIVEGQTLNGFDATTILAAGTPGAVYVAAGVSTITRDSNEMDLLVSYTKGATTGLEIMHQFSDDGTNWYYLTASSMALGVATDYLIVDTIPAPAGLSITMIIPVGVYGKYYRPVYRTTSAGAHDATLTLKAHVRKYLTTV